MKCIGLLGGMSWQSTATYYQLINQAVAAELGGLHSAPILLYSFDFATIEQLQLAGNWDAAAQLLLSQAQALQQAGAQAIAICTNTMHKVAPLIEQTLTIPLLHIADASARALAADNITTVALLGTQYTMTQDFYKTRLQQAGLTVIVPNQAAQQCVHDIIFQELCQGHILAPSQQQLLQIIEQLAAQGAQGVLLACTELGLLLPPHSATIPLLDTATIHAQYLAQFVLAKV